ncbi:MAG: DUF4032 domain-containing protein [Acidimicrobiales bacterium]
MAVRLQLVSGHQPPDLLDLPWSVPLASWDPGLLVQMAHGASRHVVRFAALGERVYALKETAEADAGREYRMLRDLAADRLPVVEAVGLVTGRASDDGAPLDGVLVTRYLDFSLPYSYLFRAEGHPDLARRLIDAAVVLLVRLHLRGFFWGDCSLANLLFRRDAGALRAYLVDAETARRTGGSDGMREADVDLAREHIAGGLLDLAAAGQGVDGVDPLATAELFAERYAALWRELTGPEEADDMGRHAVERRTRRLNELGFDVGELVVEREHGAARVRVYPALVEEGHHARRLRRLTGLDVLENQARRLLNDISSYGAHLARVEGSVVPEAPLASRWIAEVYEPLVASVPADLRGRLEPAELFHELLEHRYFLSEAAGYEVGNEAALGSYVDSVLRFRRVEQVLADGVPPGEEVLHGRPPVVQNPPTRREEGDP